jgi:hypothetical protein
MGREGRGQHLSTLVLHPEQLYLAPQGLNPSLSTPSLMIGYSFTGPTQRPGLHSQALSAIQEPTGSRRSRPHNQGSEAALRQGVRQGLQAGGRKGSGVRSPEQAPPAFSPESDSTPVIQLGVEGPAGCSREPCTRPQTAGGLDREDLELDVGEVLSERRLGLASDVVGTARAQAAHEVMGGGNRGLGVALGHGAPVQAPAAPAPTTSPRPAQRPHLSRGIARPPPPRPSPASPPAALPLPPLLPMVPPLSPRPPQG